MRIGAGLVVGLICGLVGSVAQAAESGPRTLSFEDRVKAQVRHHCGDPGKLAVPSRRPEQGSANSRKYPIDHWDRLAYVPL